MPFRGRYIPLSLILFLIRSGIALSQFYPVDTAQVFPSLRQASLHFDRNVNTYGWEGRASYGIREEGWDVRLTDRFQSSLVRTDRSFIKDENNFLFRASKQIVPAFSLAARASSVIFSDQRTIGLNSLAGHALLAGPQWTPIAELTVMPLAGVKIENQLGERDQGFIFDGGARLQPLQFGLYSASGEIRYISERLDPRYAEERRVAAQLHARFTSDAENRLFAEYRRLRRDFYLPFDSTVSSLYDVTHPVEIRDEEIFSIADQLQYQFSSPLIFTLTIDASQRSIAKKQKYRNTISAIPVFDSDIGEFRLNGSMGLQYFADGTQAEIRAAVNERDESHTIDRFPGADPIAWQRQIRLEEQKNNAIHQTQLTLQLSHAFSAQDTLILAGSTLKMVYDTPSASNVDDRDELFFLINAQWIRRFSDFFTARVQAEANLRHTVYISGERSANNMWNRVFRFASATEYRPREWFLSKNNAEVVANYSVYDFENEVQSVRSFSLRQMTIGDSTSVRLHRGLWLTGLFQLRLYERGQIRWSTFTLRPLNYFDERTYTILLHVSGERHHILPGFRYFEQKRYAYSGSEKKFEGSIQNYGPLCRLELDFPSGARVYTDIWYQLTKETNLAVRRVPSVTVNVLWNL